MHIFWETVKKEIDKQNTSFEWLYVKTGIPKGTFATWKKRDVLPRVDEALKIARALDVSLEYLVTGTLNANVNVSDEIREMFNQYLKFCNDDQEAVRALINRMYKKYP